MVTIYETFEVGQILIDKNLGCEWIVREKIPGGVRLQYNKPGGPILDASNIGGTCNLVLVPKPRFYKIWLQESDVPSGISDFETCLKAVREPSVEEAEDYLTPDRGTDPALHVVRVQEVSREEAEKSFDLSSESTWPIFGIEDYIKASYVGKKVFSRDAKKTGTVTGKGKRFCAACQKVMPYYSVLWEDGRRTKPCTAGIDKFGYALKIR